MLEKYDTHLRLMPEKQAEAVRGKVMHTPRFEEPKPESLPTDTLFDGLLRVKLLVTHSYSKQA